jgi:hypothetical protein
MASAEGQRRVRRASAPEVAAAVSVLFKHPSGARAKRVKLGFAWDLFLFAGVFGVPLFLRGLANWGAAILGLWLIDFGLGRFGRGPLQHPAEVALFTAFLGLQLWLGFKGNALTARAYRARGWTADNQRDPAVRLALEKWGLS